MRIQRGVRVPRRHGTAATLVPRRRRVQIRASGEKHEGCTRTTNLTAQEAGWMDMHQRECRTVT